MEQINETPVESVEVPSEVTSTETIDTPVEEVVAEVKADIEEVTA